MGFLRYVKEEEEKEWFSEDPGMEIRGEREREREKEEGGGW